MGSSSASASGPLVLLTGATGYIGGRLLKALENAGTRVRCLARHPEFLEPRAAPNTEVVKGDCLDQASLPPVMAGVHTAYYLVHSMGSPGRFEEQDRQAARNFAASARQAGVCRIIYLGGLGAEGQSLSAHLRSRQEVADILRFSGVPTIEFRASIVIGSGSLSFEMIRALVQRLPVMICPRWVDSQGRTHRGRGCDCLPNGSARLAGGTGIHIRDRWHRPGELWRNNARVCPAMRSPPMDDPSSSLNASPLEFVVGPGHSYLCSHWPQTC